MTSDWPLVPGDRAQIQAIGERLREEDPFTGQAIVDVPTHVIVHRSRFEFDLNRAAAEAVYLTTDQSWGLDVWHTPPPDQVVQRSLAIHGAYYAMLGHLLDGVDHLQHLAHRLGERQRRFRGGDLLQPAGEDRVVVRVGQDDEPFPREDARRLDERLVVGEERALVADHLELHPVRQARLATEEANRVATALSRSRRRGRQ